MKRPKRRSLLSIPPKPLAEALADRVVKELEQRGHIVAL